MPIGQLGSIVTFCVGLIITGASILFPDNPIIAWTLIIVGLLVAIAAGTFFVARLSADKPEHEKRTSGDIKITAGDGNKFGNVGHRSGRDDE
jgi:hypothetical protein